MKHFISAFISLLLLFPAYAQETRQVVKEYYNEQTKEVYNVLVSDKSVKHGPYEMCFKSKKLDEGQYVNGSKDGVWKHYTRKGTIDYIASWKAGAKHGEWKYYEDTVMISHQYYNNGLPDSVHRSYLVNGKLYAEKRFKKGKPYGLWKEYYASGKLASETVRINETHITSSKTYFEDGTIRSKTVAHKGDSIARTEAFYKGGKKRYEMLEKYGVPFNVISYYKPNGDTIDFGTLKNGNGTLKQYYDTNIVILYSIEEYKNSKLNGDAVYFHDNGEMACTGIMRDGLMHGKWEFYDRKGKLKSHKARTGQPMRPTDLPSNNYSLPFQMFEPEFHGPNLMAYIDRNKIDPSETQTRGELYVKMRFTINELGEVTNVQVVDGDSKEADNEAMRLISILPRFSPAMYQGEAIPFDYTITITFSMKK